MLRTLATRVLWGDFPSSWRKPRLKPIPKGPSSPGELRPIQVLSVVDKLVQALFVSRLKVKTEHLVSPDQAGYRDFYSCELSIAKITESALASRAAQRTTGIIAVDFVKAFDKVRREVLVEKLQRKYDLEAEYLDLHG